MCRWELVFCSGSPLSTFTILPLRPLPRVLAFHYNIGFPRREDVHSLGAVGEEWQGPAQPPPVQALGCQPWLSPVYYFKVITLPHFVGSDPLPFLKEGSVDAATMLEEKKGSLSWILI